jgi:hypothetical protein
MVVGMTVRAVQVPSFDGPAAVVCREIPEPGRESS